MAAKKGIWQGYPLDAEGNLIPGAEITIRDLNGNTVDLWEDEDGSVTKSNPFQANSNGYAFAYADTGYHDIQAQSGTANANLSRVHIQAEVDDAVSIAQGAAGAPRIQNAALAGIPFGSAQIAANAVGQSEIASNAVGRSQVKTGTNSVSGSVIEDVVDTITLNQYSFFPSISSHPDVRMLGGEGSASASSPKFGLTTSSNFYRSYSVAWRFIQS